MSVINHTPIFGEAAFIEALLRPIVGIQSFEVDSLEVHLVKNIAYQRIYRISAITLVPVVAVANHDAYFSFTLSVIDAVIGTVANVLPIQGLYGKLVLDWPSTA